MDTMKALLSPLVPERVELFNSTLHGWAAFYRMRVVVDRGGGGGGGGGVTYPEFLRKQITSFSINCSFSCLLYE